MRLIPLTQGRAALVDDEDFPSLSRHKWHALKRPTTFYALRKVRQSGRPRQRPLAMHVQIMGAAAGQLIDHINGDGLDNRRANLRFATASQNACNARPHTNGGSGFKGVTYYKRLGKWQAQIKLGSRHLYLGLFTSPEAAARAYDAKASALHGAFARLNYPLEYAS